MTQWYYAQGGKQNGPVSLDDLKRMAGSRQLQPTDLVFQMGTANWVSASTVPGLFSAEVEELVEVEPLADDGPPPSPRDETDGEPLPLRMWRSLSWHVNRMPVTRPERRELRQIGVSEPAAQRYLVWRRTLLYLIIGLTGVGALIGTVSHLETLINFNERENQTLRFTYPGAKISISGLGILVDAITILGLFAMPLTALLAMLNWSRPRASYRMLLLGLAIGFLLPLLLGLIPIRWRFTLTGMPAADQAGFYVGRGLVFAFGSLVLLITIMLSLIAGVVAGSLRVKSLLPGSIVPGWFLLGACSLQALVIFVVFITINYVATAFWILLAIALYLSALIVYLFNWKTFVSPLSVADSDQRLTNVRIFNLLFSCLGTLIFLVYLFTTKIGEMRLVGFDSEKSALTVWKLLELYIGYFGRLLFITVLAFDLLTRVNLSVWSTATKFSNSADDQDYQRVLTELDTTLRKN